MQIYKVFKAWKQIKLEDNNINDIFLNNIILKNKQYLGKINTNYNILKEMKIQLINTRK